MNPLCGRGEVTEEVGERRVGERKVHTFNWMRCREDRRCEAVDSEDVRYAVCADDGRRFSG